MQKSLRLVGALLACVFVLGCQSQSVGLPETAEESAVSSSVVVLRHADPVEMAATLNAFIAQQDGAAASPLQVVAGPDGALLLRGDPARVAQAVKLATQLDVPAPVRG